MLSLQQGQKLSQQMAPAMRQSIRMLAMNLPELRQEIVREISENPLIDDLDHTLELPMDAVVTRASARDEAYSTAVPEDEDAPSVSPDEDAVERRQRFFDSQVREETLQEHVENQSPISDIPPQDHVLGEMLIGNLNDDGYFTGSIPDIVMVSCASEKHVLRVLAEILYVHRKDLYRLTHGGRQIL